MKLADYKELWHKKYGESTVEFGFNAVAGYTTGLVAKEGDSYISRAVSAQIAEP